MRIAFIYLDEGLLDGNEVFAVVDQVHTRGWSFGQGVFSTLDIFYLAQIAAGIYPSFYQVNDDLPLTNGFDSFYAERRQLLNQEAWRKQYSAVFLAQPTSARFYRLPDLRDLPHSNDPLGQLRQQKKTDQFTKLIRLCVHAGEQPALPDTTLTEVILSTLRQTIVTPTKL
ncbi:hypothetical protein CDEST_09778 [Colletotrichum destructivum]|uniref:Uncharacterized protein n=1 Tax=Colletotrichum destructivum TaxID=34406 RepID=A0AAX4IN19_9PEZI|nr:hypothetical protein CDEST_09778 [Colletotrichum destructivum]